ncbi:MAG: dethiobiotin synthase [Nonlabens sp.]
MNSIFITGIGTDVGKTVVAAIVVQALEADYWKPIQSGLDLTDRGTLQDLVTNKTTTFHPEAYRLKTPMSPHAAAQIDGVEVQLNNLVRPSTQNKLVIEGAGGLMVPINNQHTIADLIKPTDQVILVSSGYLGSINHTLLSVEYLKYRDLNCAGIVYNNVQLDGTIEVIEKMTGITTLGHIDREEAINSQVVQQYAHLFKATLEKL